MPSTAASAAIFAFLAHPLSLLCHVAHVCAGYLGLKNPKPLAPVSSPAPPPAAASQQGEVAAASDDNTAGIQVRPRGFTPAQQPRSTPLESTEGSGGCHN
ncbi:hypothetical protein PVAP13_6NG048430 [Panicum virgatum]|uniref:Secreted protein n=1 Tax=Panicum virgatum TaxID=38727 RepID=A0A8T0QV58_PANVG|nr:hypothetical protein PVAP13_6NG048430 [Panicum virgatum]